MNTPNTNGRPLRKTLSSQLDRLDGIIDTLADGLNGAVADAVRDAVTLAVQQAVEVVLREVLSRPELLRHLTGQAVPVAAPAEPTPQKPTKMKRLVGWVGSKVANVCKWLGSKCSSARMGMSQISSGLFRRIGENAHKGWELRKPLSVSLVIGFLVGSIGYLAGPLLASLALGLGSSAASLFGILAAPYVRLWRSLQT